MEENEANRSEKVRKGLRNEGYYYRRHVRADAEHRGNRAVRGTATYHTHCIFEYE